MRPPSLECACARRRVQLDRADGATKICFVLWGNHDWSNIESDAMKMDVHVTNNAETWRSALSCFSSYDFVHTYDFGRVSALNGEGEPLLFCVTTSNNELICCWPLLRRKIPGSDYYDLGSVYGYGGPLISRDLNDDTCVAALELLFEHMKRDGYVSIFSRMHPLFIERIPSSLRGDRLGDVVVIDVGQGGEDVMMTYKKSLRYKMRKIMKRGIDLLVDVDCLFLDEFIEIYKRAMQELNAADYYFFDYDYYRSLADSSDFKTILTFAVYEGKKISAGMSIVTNDIMQAHLGGSLPGYRDLSPSRLIVAKEHETARKMGARHFVLGGGLGSENDALYEYKLSFSKRTEPFYVFSKILDKDVYDDLCEKQGICSDDGSFFPLYRSRL